ncbi:ATP-dependent protease ATPase subunit HslU [Hydrogenibacillus sp. N12]|uniref:ATP-dependent protease ATPase subunit HslU n=1 Tax=Hydrogenibacillus sp. N12 TaxID=2866627 RepID=UPI001C7D9A69|nr:ATP-dependent protease ATPase subunit HslU [Hydrogenibacillus sp. N12]QZA33493.1 ATP-dependent protease ATPase subunit HslU [Hydrogenibacillus sp. N12]
MNGKTLTPREIVAELDKYIVGQEAAKRAVAVALRNRYRRSRLPEPLRDEVMPKNILMIGPTGVGKTEIARRLARLVGAPFVKVEATKFTEVGYVGRDVDAMVRDLVEAAIHLVKQEKMALVEAEARRRAEERLVDLLVPSGRRTDRRPENPLEMFFGPFGGAGGQSGEPRPAGDDATREHVRAQLRAGQLEDTLVEIEVEDSAPTPLEIIAGAGASEFGLNVKDLFGSFLPRRTKRRRLPVREARPILIQEEAQKLIDMEEVREEAIRRAEQEGIIFIDEIDKIAGREGTAGPDVSREGVQRDILPLVEGSTVMTKYGPVKTDHILFIAAGAFHVAKPSDLIPELQGRFPVRVELSALTEDDFVRILTEPENALIKQYTALIETEGVRVQFTPEAIREIARLAAAVNAHTENIGARRLHTILEKLLERLSFEAPERSGETVVITPEVVRAEVGPIAEDRDLSRYIL